MSRQEPSWDALLETPAQQRARNLKARDSARKPPPRFAQPGHVCELCDKPVMALMGMQRFDKQGTVMACGRCLAELCGDATDDVWPTGPEAVRLEAPATVAAAASASRR